MKIISVIFLMLLSGHLNALEISSMFEVMQDDKARFVVKNTAQHRIYLHIGVASLAVVDGNLVKTPYTRNNIAQWEVSVRPAKTIIEPGFEKPLEVTYHCKQQCEQTRDKMFQLSVVPTPYFPEGAPNHNAVQMAIGFAPIVTKVNQEQLPTYTIRHLGEQVEFINLGSSMFNATLQSCDDKKRCRTQAKVLAGRTLKYTLPEAMKNTPLTLTISSALGQHQHNVSLGVGAEVSK